jgi:hypothetical protein
MFGYRKKGWKKFFKPSFLVFLTMIALVVFSFFFYLKIKKSETVISEINSKKSTEEKNEKINEIRTDSIGKEEVLPVEEIDEEGTLSSENYKISQVYFGGSVALLENDFDPDPVEISFNRAETFIAKDGNESKIVISWKTSSPAISEIEYSQSGGQNPSVIREKEYGINHNVTIGNLSPGNAYLYRIKVKDRWNNEDKTNYIGIYTDKKEESVFDLIAGAIEDVFGWAL